MAIHPYMVDGSLEVKMDGKHEDSLGTKSENLFSFGFGSRISFFLRPVVQKRSFSRCRLNS